MNCDQTGQQRLLLFAFQVMEGALVKIQSCRLMFMTSRQNPAAMARILMASRLASRQMLISFR